MSSKPIYIENDRLVITGLKDQDLDRLKAMRCDRRIYRYEPTFLAELQGTPEEALRAIKSMDLLKDRQCILGVYEKKAPDVLIGLAELYDYKPSGKVISVGHRFLQEYWGKGLATSCLQALVDYIKNNTEVILVTGHVIPGNVASSRSVVKAGFEYLLTKTEDWGYGGQTLTDVYTMDL